MHEIKYLETALANNDDKKNTRRFINKIFRNSHASLIGLSKNKNDRTDFVDHLVVNKRGDIVHYGIHGIRGYDPENPNEVQFKNTLGEPVEYEEIGEVPDKRHPARKRVKRTRRVKKSTGKMGKNRE